jgi:dTDP-glucose 4,6-dehydratase
MRFRRVLVTGGAGFIGSNFVRRLLDGTYARHPGIEADAVVVLDKLTYAGNQENLDPVADDPRLDFQHGDICEPELVAELMRGTDLVVHFAAESHVDRSILDSAEFVLTNVVGTQILLDAAREAGVGTLVHVSTDEVYGSIESGSWTEAEPVAPNSPYAASKASSDLLALAYHRTHGLDVRVTRCTNNYGQYQYPEKVIPRFVTNLLEDRKVPLFGDGGNVREWLHVDDHCRGIALVAASGTPGETYNIGGGTELSNRELAGKLLEIMEKGTDMIEAVSDRKGHDRRYSVDDTKIREELGYQPQVDFAQGLANTVQWYTENREWWEPLKWQAEQAVR